LKVNKNEVNFEGRLVVKKVGETFTVNFYVEGDSTGPFNLGNFASVPEQVIKEFEL